MYERIRSFTVVEAILTIVIMGILAMVVLPRFVKTGFIAGLTLRSTSSQIASDIRYTRRLAITNSSHYIIKFDFSQKEYKIYKDSISPENQIGETKKISPDITLTGTDQFDFYSLGNCQLSPISDGLLLSLNTSQYKITAEPPTGAVIVEKIS